ncbi:MobF family relaxase [Caballeronia sordidicola]|uniref:IncW plasmid conjugative relaxase protein TrwC (TraI) n=1 Tax=Caballeronia sordidicola TaxID=196367 RepID=A0A226X3K5_CABSO|nr:MobF family relaxase [Caballeronia sordidicola]OXC78022.1 IncW plasmid conjugative relaxase protein TrwC (TraI) [Caballeronia sordidicola]
MLNITTITRQSAGKVVSYYADSADDYYAKDGSAMQWQGRGAAALGLKGAVEQERFRELLDGRIDSVTRIKRSVGSERLKERLGYDLTFSAPKGVSLQALVHGDQRIIAAHDKAVAAAIGEAELLAMARSTVNKKTSIEHTKNLVVAKFRHETSRELDPDLHTHAFVLNMTQRGNGQWRALTNDGVIHSLSHLGNVYKAALAKELELAGFVLRYDRNGTFDLAHFSEHQISEFSARSRQIEAALAQKGLDRASATQAEKNQAAMATRQRKGAIDRDAIREIWKERSDALGIDYASREWAGAGNRTFGPEAPTKAPQLEKPLAHHADQIVKFGIKSLTERQSIITAQELMEVSLRHGYGILSSDDVRAAIDRAGKGGHLIKEEALFTSMNPAKDARSTTAKPVSAPAPTPMSRADWVSSLVRAGKTRDEAAALVAKGIERGRLKPGDERFTTHIAQRRERDILAFERESRGTVTPRISKEAIAAFLSGTTLNAEQSRAVSRIAESRNRYMAVPGFAGTGKSFMTKAARDLMEGHGYRVTTLAPYGSQKKALEAEGLDARTLQSFLKAKDKKIDGNTIVFIDESGVIPARQMHETMKAVQEAGARVVFLGDTAQTKAIEAGKPFEQLMKAGMQTSYMTTIQRQKDPDLLKAVELAAVGHSRESLAHVSAISEIREASDRYRSIVEAYAGLDRTGRAQTLVITGTNDSRKKINHGIQQALGLSGTGQDYPLLNRLDTTQAERRHSKYYEKGAIIIPERDYHCGLKRGEQYTVLDTGPGNRLTVHDRDGAVLQFSPARTTQLSVYNIEQTEIAPGDQIKITRNDAEKDLANGDRFIVKSIGDGEIALESDGRKVTIDARSPMFVGLAYASTVHSAQGLTCDTVLINLETKSRTTAQDVYYVAVSRARHEALIFTDDGKKLGEAVSRESSKTAALELSQLQRHGSSHEPNNRMQHEQTRQKEKGDREMGYGK